MNVMLYLLRIWRANIFRVLPVIVCSFALMALPLSAAPFAYVTRFANHSVSVIDTATNSVVVDSIPVGLYPVGAAITPDGKRVYITNNGSDSVSIIDTATNTVVKSIPVGVNPHGVAVTPDGKRVYVATNNGGVWVIDTSTNTVVASISGGDLPVGVAITPDGKRAYVTNMGGNDVSVIDTATNTAVVQSIPVGINPNSVTVTPDGKRVYVANSTNVVNGNVSVIDTTTNMVVETIPAGLLPRGLAVTPDGKRVYVVNLNSFDVSVIDTATNTLVIQSIPVGLYPTGVAITPDGKRVYVSNNASNDVSVIDTATNTVVASIPFSNAGGSPSGPSAIALTPLPNSINATFNVNTLIIDHRHSALFMASKFAIGKDGNGINPINEAVTLNVGTVTITIPAGSFHKNRRGLFTFAGQIDDVFILAFITPLGHNRFGFQAAEYGADLSGIKNPVQVQLNIGNDSGITSVNAIIRK